MKLIKTSLQAALLGALLAFGSHALAGISVEEAAKLKDRKSVV